MSDLCATPELDAIDVSSELAACPVVTDHHPTVAADPLSH